jgi:hypothetical protein
MLWLATLGAVAGGVAALVVFVTGPDKERTRAEAIRPGAPQVVKRSRRVPLAKAELGRVHDVAVRFIDTAVRRKHVDDSWAITDASLKTGFTRTEWAQGNIPAPPFPADSPQYAPYRVLYTFPNDVALVFALLPEHGHPNYSPSSFTVELVKRHGRWLVSSFTPSSVGNVDQVQQRGQLKNELTGNAPGPEKGQLSAWWLVVPALFVLLLAVVVPMWFLTRNRMRRARIARAYNSSSSPS